MLAQAERASTRLLEILGSGTGAPPPTGCPSTPSRTWSATVTRTSSASTLTGCASSANCPRRTFAGARRLDAVGVDSTCSCRTTPAGAWSGSPRPAAGPGCSSSTRPAARYAAGSANSA
ncbi:hypothetical protein NKH77_39670 [Streptomyces sp. M19]